MAGGEEDTEGGCEGDEFDEADQAAFGYVRLWTLSLSLFLSLSWEANTLVCRWNILSCLARDPKLEFDDARLVESLDAVHAEMNTMMLQEHSEFLKALYEREGKA